MKRLCCAALAFVAVSVPFPAAGATPFAIANVTLLDGRGGPARREVTVVITAGRIAALWSKGARIPRGMSRINGRGRYLMPGFIDMHAHLLVPRCTASLGQSSRFDRRLSEQMLSTLLDFGITTVRSPATPTEQGLLLRDDLNAGRIRGPRALASAELVNDDRMDERALRNYVRDALKYRPDYFKVYARLTPEQVKTVVDEAHKHGIPVIGHLQNTSWLEGARLGIDYLTHAADWSAKTLRPRFRETYARAIRDRGPLKARLYWLQAIDLKSKEVAETISELVRRGISVDPTLVAYDSKFSGPGARRYRENRFLSLHPQLTDDWHSCADSTSDWTANDRARWRRLLPKLQGFVRLMHSRGVLLTTGSDLTNEWVIPGESLHQEFELLQQSGFRPAQILRMAGENGSRALKRPDVGVVEPGRRADLVLLSSNPLADIANTRSIVWVMQGGKIVSNGPAASSQRD